MSEFTKEFFQTAWGESGYYENFSYGVGIDKVCGVCLFPFLNKTKSVLEIGSGGGVFTDKIIDKVKHLTAIDVIKMPEQFEKYRNFTYIELTDKSYDCAGIEDNSIDFAFSYNTFCHLSNEAIEKYLKGVNRVLKPYGDFVFMLSNFDNIKHHFADTANEYKRGDLLPNGHYYQDNETLLRVLDIEQWGFGSSNMLPEHRDILIHLRKFY